MTDLSTLFDASLIFCITFLLVCLIATSFLICAQERIRKNNSKPKFHKGVSQFSVDRKFIKYSISFVGISIAFVSILMTILSVVTLCDLFNSISQIKLVQSLGKSVVKSQDVPLYVIIEEIMEFLRIEYFLLPKMTYGFAAKYGPIATQGMRILKDPSNIDLLLSFSDLSKLITDAKSAVQAIVMIQDILKTIDLEAIGDNILEASPLKCVKMVYPSDISFVFVLIKYFLTKQLNSIMIMLCIVVIGIYLLTVNFAAMIVLDSLFRFRCTFFTILSILSMIFLALFSMLFILALNIKKYINNEPFVTQKTIENIDSDSTDDNSELFDDIIAIVKIIINNENPRTNPEMTKKLLSIKQTALKLIEENVLINLNISDMRFYFNNGIKSNSVKSMFKLNLKTLPDPQQITFLPILPINTRNGLMHLNLKKMEDFLAQIVSVIKPEYRDEIKEDLIRLDSHIIQYIIMMLNTISHDPSNFIHYSLGDLDSLNGLFSP